MDVLSYTLGKKAGGGGSTPVLQDKEVTITQNGESTVTKDSGYDGLGTVTIDTGVKYKPKYISFAIVGARGADQNPVPSLEYEVENLDTSLLTKMPKMFNGCTFIKRLNLSAWDTSNVVSMQQMFMACNSLQKIDASGFTAKANVVFDSVFNNCKSLSLLDMRNFDFTLAQVGASPFYNVPTTCEIVVADNTQKEWFATNFISYTNVMTATEYDAKCHIHLEYGDGESISKKYYYSININDTTTLPDSTDVTPPIHKVFDHWEDSEGNTVTSFTATTNNSVEFTAIYVDSE